MTSRKRTAGWIALGGLVAAAGTATWLARRQGSSIGGWLAGNVVVPLLYRKGGGIEAMQARIAENRQQGPALPSAKLRKRYDVADERWPGCRVLRLAPKGGGAADRRLLYIHGGAYVFDLMALQWPIVTGLVDRLGAEVVIPIYPLAPEQDVDAGLAAVDAVFEALAAEIGAANVVVVGDSAGGGLALALAQARRDCGAALPGALVLIFPWLDATACDPSQPELEAADPILSLDTLRWAGRAWAGDADPVDPKASPLFGSAEGLPPTLLLVGTKDLLLADARRYAERCPEATLIEYPGMIHGFICLPIPEARAALDAIAAFVADVAA